MVPAVFAEGMPVNGDCFGERESISKTAGGHISCKCSQMLVKVYLLCTCDWKNSFLEGLLTPEARASFLLGLCIFVFVASSFASSPGLNELSFAVVPLFIHIQICCLSFSLCVDG